MKTHLISLRSLAFFCISSALCATMPPPENGLADLIAWKWTSISAKRLEILPEGALKDEYTHTDGEDVTITHREQNEHVKNLIKCIALKELRIGASSNWASSITHSFCLGCNTYCIYGKCGYVVEISTTPREYGLVTIAEVL